MAWTRDPTKPVEWTRVKENPVLTPCDADVREFETLTLYKSISRDPQRTLGAPFVKFDNAKNKNGYERIGIATSKGMVNWRRYGPNHVLANGGDKRNGMSADPQVVRMDDPWVMFYFGAGWKPKACDTFAVSRDRVNWPKGPATAVLHFLLEQHGLSAADLSRLLGAERSLGPKILRGERRLTLDHVRVLARPFNVEPGVFLD